MSHILVALNFISDLLEYLGTVSTQNDLMPILAARGKGDKFCFYFLLCFKFILLYAVASLLCNLFKTRRTKS